MKFVPVSCNYYHMYKSLPSTNLKAYCAFWHNFYSIDFSVYIFHFHLFRNSKFCYNTDTRTWTSSLQCHVYLYKGRMTELCDEWGNLFLLYHFSYCRVALQTLESFSKFSDLLDACLICLWQVPHKSSFVLEEQELSMRERYWK